MAGRHKVVLACPAEVCSCLFVTAIIRISPSERFNGLLEALFNDVRTKATNPWFPLALVELAVIKLIWRQLQRMSRRAAAI